MNEKKLEPVSTSYYIKNLYWKIKVCLFLTFLFSCNILLCQDYGDFYIDAFLGDASFLNPILATDSASGSINSLIYNGLVKYDKDLNLVGDLAEKWKINNNGLEITFYLKKNVYWHDGIKFTSKDVKYTYEKLVDPQIKTPYSSDYLIIKKCEIIDEHTIKFIYKERFAPMLESWGMGIIPEHVYNRNIDFHKNPANREPIGTGPYKFKKWIVDEKIELEANENYFEGKPYISKYVCKIIPDQSVQFLELLNQSIDSMNLTPDQSIAYKTFFVNYNKFSYPSFQYVYLGFNLKRDIFKDRKLRQAIAHAINKDEIIKGVLLEKGKPATGPFPPQSWAYNADVKDFAYDLELSKKILSEIGYKDMDGDGYLEKFTDDRKKKEKLQFTIMTNQGNKPRQLTAEIIQSQLKRIGIKVDIQIIEWSVFINNFIHPRNFDAVILGWSLSRDPDQYSIWHSKEVNPGQYNFVSYCNPEIDNLLEIGRSEFNLEKRKIIYKKIHKIIHDDIPYIFLYYPEALPVVHKRFYNVQLTKAGIGWNFTKWYVPKSIQKYSLLVDY